MAGRSTAKTFTDAMAEINTSDPENPMFRHVTQDGRVISFSVCSVEEGARGWLVEVLGRQLHELYANAYAKGRDDCRSAVKKALGMQS